MAKKSGTEDFDYRPTKTSTIRRDEGYRPTKPSPFKPPNQDSIVHPDPKKK